MNNDVLDLIIILVKAAKNNGQIECENDYIDNCFYLLNQTIRQYKQPQSHYFVSERALELWDSLTTEDILSKSYRDKVILDRANGKIQVEFFKGNELKPYKKCSPKKNDEIVYKDVFHDEHIVPIKTIINALIDLEELSYDNVRSILNNIYICKMLKSEDKGITRKSNRSLDYLEAIKECYKTAKKPITCINAVTNEKI